MVKTPISKIVIAQGCETPRRTPALVRPAMKARQSEKIREIRQAVIASGFVSLDKQAAALGLRRSTAWTVLKANHKASGLSATVIKRMLMSPQLPTAVRQIIKEYVEQKCAGDYGHSRARLQMFRARLGQDAPLSGDGFASMVAEALDQRCSSPRSHRDET